MKILVSIVTLLLFISSGYALATKEKAPDKMEEWSKAKLGMFVHWGPYCLYGGMYNGHRITRPGAEWIMNSCHIPVMEYRTKASCFNPVDFCADSLVLLAKRTGMKYLVITAKHHDGFAMFKSKASRFNIVDYTPLGRDIVDEVAQSCRKHGIKFGLYYSQSQDWNHPGGAKAARFFPPYGFKHPEQEYLDEYVRTHDGAWDPYQTTNSFDEYIDSVAVPQIKELLERYPDLFCLFFDTPGMMTDNAAEKIIAILEQYPNLVVNDRLARPLFPGDYKTPEERVPESKDVEGIYWESCMTIGRSWGYRSWEKRWRSPDEIIQNISKIAARGGNFLLNVGPDGDGHIPAQAVACLDSVGRWMAENGEGIIGTRRSSISVDWGDVVAKDEDKDSFLYLFVYNVPKDGKLNIPIQNSCAAATLLSSGQQLRFSNKKGRIELSLPGTITKKPVIKIRLKKKLPAENISRYAERYFEVIDDGVRK